MSNHKTRKQSPEFIGFKSTGEEHARKDDLKRYNAANKLISIVLGELQYIQELMGLNKIAPVEDIEEKIERSQKKINDTLNRYEQDETLGYGDTSTQPQNQTASLNLPIEQHPFLEDMGGMPLEMDNLDKEFLKELGITETQDKAEMENQIKNKLKEKLKNTLKFAAKLSQKLANQPKYQPALKQANELVVKYKLALEALKNKPLLKPEAPEYTPRPHYTPTPRPPGT